MMEAYKLQAYVNEKGEIKIPKRLKKLYNNSVEIIIFPKNTAREEDDSEQVFNPEEFEGKLILENSKEEISKIRDEWERI